MQYNRIFFVLLFYGGCICLGPVIGSTWDDCKDGKEKVNGTIWYRCINRSYKEIGCYFLEQKFLHNTTINDGKAEFFCNFTAFNKTVVSITACLLSGSRLELGRGFANGNFYYTCARRNLTVYLRISDCADDDNNVVPFGYAFLTTHFLLQCMRISESDVYVRVMACAIDANPVQFGQNSTDDQYWYSCTENGEQIVKEIKGCFVQNTFYHPGKTYVKNGTAYVCQLPATYRWTKRNRKERMFIDHVYNLVPVHDLIVSDGKKPLTPAFGSNLPGSGVPASDGNSVSGPEKGSPGYSPDLPHGQHSHPGPVNGYFPPRPSPLPRENVDVIKRPGSNLLRPGVPASDGNSVSGPEKGSPGYSPDLPHGQHSHPGPVNGYLPPHPSPLPRENVDVIKRPGSNLLRPGVPASDGNSVSGPEKGSPGHSPGLPHGQHSHPGSVNGYFPPPPSSLPRENVDVIKRPANGRDAENHTPGHNSDPHGRNNYDDSEYYQIWGVTGPVNANGRPLDKKGVRTEAPTIVPDPYGSKARNNSDYYRLLGIPQSGNPCLRHAANQEGRSHASRNGANYNGNNDCNNFHYEGVGGRITFVHPNGESALNGDVQSQSPRNGASSSGRNYGDGIVFNNVGNGPHSYHLPGLNAGKQDAQTQTSLGSLNSYAHNQGSGNVYNHIRGTSNQHHPPGGNAGRHDAQTQTPWGSLNSYGRNQDGATVNIYQYTGKTANSAYLNGHPAGPQEDGILTPRNVEDSYGHRITDGTGNLRIDGGPTRMDPYGIPEETHSKKPCRYSNFGNMGYHPLDDSNNLVRYQRAFVPLAPGNGGKCRPPSIQKETQPVLHVIVHSILGQHSVASSRLCTSLNGLCARLDTVPAAAMEQPHCPVTLAGKQYRFNPGFGLRFKGELLLCEIDIEGNPVLFTYLSADCDKEPKLDWNVVQTVGKTSASNNLARPSRATSCNALDGFCAQTSHLNVGSKEKPHCPVVIFDKIYRFNAEFGMRFKGELFICTEDSDGEVSLFTYRTEDCSREPQGDWKVLKVVA